MIVFLQTNGPLEVVVGMNDVDHNYLNAGLEIIQFLH
jgi:hypothetical protein